MGIDRIERWSNSLPYLQKRDRDDTAQVVTDSLPCNCWSCRQTPSLPTSIPQLPLHNIFEALVLEREVIKDAVEAASKRLPRGKE